MIDLESTPSRRRGLKFSALLPRELAVETPPTRLADFPAAAGVLTEPAHLMVQ
ncbi:hypothetical protein [Microbispora triticiradicis]|uniref:hypothetical protein n=1 Tax=Microbispora TaxID=2005 RepID=UPI00142F1EA8|nr:MULTISPECIES: hypothetical protein [Microbispora]